MTQCEAILAALRRGEVVTPETAYRLCGTHALHSRISELRERGHEITTEMVETPTGKVVGRYTLQPPQDAAGAHGKAGGQQSVSASQSSNPRVVAAPSAPLSSAIDPWIPGQTRISFGRRVLVIAAGFSAHDGTAWASTRDLGPA